MQVDHTSLGKEAFGKDAASLTTVKYASHQEALKFLMSALRVPSGIGLLQGPTGSGKSTVIRELIEHLSHDAVVAYVDVSKLKPRRLLTSILSQFEVSTDSEPDDELLKMVSDFAKELTRQYQSPILILDNVDRLYPSALRIVNLLALLSEDQHHTMRLILTGREGLSALVESPGMTSVAARSPASYPLKPLSAKEAMIYLHARLEAAGSDRAETVFPFDVCDRLREQSGGWPGILNYFAFEAIERASDFPVSVLDTYAQRGHEDSASRKEELVVRKEEASVGDTAAQRLPPKLLISKDGNSIGEYTFNQNKVLIGRSDFADVIVDDDFVSKIHAVMLLYADALVLLDLNSANGTTVNSVLIKKTILRTDDILSLGNHRLKVENAPVMTSEMEKMVKSPDTLRMKNLIDLRRHKAKMALHSVGKKTS